MSTIRNHKVEISTPPAGRRLRQRGALLLGVGARIKEVRLFFGLSQNEMGRRAGQSRSNISEIENDKVKPSVELIAAISQIHPEINLSYVLFGHGDMLGSDLIPVLRLDRLPAIIEAMLAVSAHDQDTAELRGQLVLGRIANG